LCLTYENKHIYTHLITDVVKSIHTEWTLAIFIFLSTASIAVTVAPIRARGCHPATTQYVISFQAGQIKGSLLHPTNAHGTQKSITSISLYRTKHYKCY
jgi:hypothetical protein